MTGFIRGLFSKRQPDEASVPKPEKVKPEKVKPAPRRAQPSDAYFLDADSAVSLGNLDYMRTVKKIRRTYAKSVNGVVPSSIKEVSSLSSSKSSQNLDLTIEQASSFDAFSASQSNGGSNTTQATPTSSQVRERRRADSSLDEFRNMAKEIRK